MDTQRLPQQLPPLSSARGATDGTHGIGDFTQWHLLHGAVALEKDEEYLGLGPKLDRALSQTDLLSAQTWT